MKEVANKIICWVCDRPILKKRIEKHHILGKNQVDVVDLCLICHDTLDRYSFGDIDVFIEYLKVIPEIAKLPKGEYPYLKLFFLKCVKVLKEAEKNGN